MGRMKQSLLNKTLKGSSLVEVLVAMVVIMIVFSIAMAIFTNVTKLSLSTKKYKAQAILEQVLIQVEKFPEDGHKKFTQHEFMIDQEVTGYLDKPGLKRVNISILDEQGEHLLQIRKVIYSYQKNN